MTRHIMILDTTLRDEEQSPGISMATSEKLTGARELLCLQVAVIEAGFPASALGDFTSVQKVAEYNRSLEALWRLKSLQVSCGIPLIATATIALQDPDGEECSTCAQSTGLQRQEL